MNVEVLLALLLKKVEERIKDLPLSRGPRGPRGRNGEDGAPGRDGKSFDVTEHGDLIRSWIKEFSVKFEDFTDEQVELLRGPRGRAGRDGNHGRDFNFDEHSETIQAWITEQIPKFESFTDAQKEEIRGQKGEDGQGFDFESNRDSIEAIIRSEIGELAESLKLKFSDLTEDDIAALRGPRGRDGKDGRNFNFDDHREFFEGLKPKFADLSADEKAELTLKFSHLSNEERDSLRLKFADLSLDEKLELKGPRGQRGKAGRDGNEGPQGEQGIQGPRGERGIQGIPGISGPRGYAGEMGADGRDGRDAPYVTGIDVRQTKNTKFALVFIFSDGSEIVTDEIDLPDKFKEVWVVGGGIRSGGGSGGGGSGQDGEDGKSAYQIWLDQGNSGTEQDFLDSLIGPAGADGPQGDPGPEGLSAYEVALADGFVGTESEWLASLVGPPGSGGGGTSTMDFDCDADVYVGSAVYLEQSNITLSVLDDWTSLSMVPTLDLIDDYDTTAKNGLADSELTANVIGIVDSKISSTRCRVISIGNSSPVFLGLDSRYEYFLSDLTPGAIVPGPLKPTTEGHFLVKIGQPLGAKILNVNKSYMFSIGGV